MIQLHSKTASNTIAYLNDMHPTERDLYIHILDGYDTVEVNNKIGFGVSHVPDNENENYEIWVAGDLPDDYLITTIVHEFAHFLQYCNREPFNEDDAEKFANKILEELQCKQAE